MKALGLFSGGLDSLLAARMVGATGLDYECVTFVTGFGKEARAAVVERARRGEALWQAESGEAPPLGGGAVLHVVDLRDEYLDRVRVPRFGHGSGLNPCIDCRVLMFREAWALAERLGAAVLFTGDVVGQRPMEQARERMQRIEREAGVEGRVLRPLCAGLMPPTEVERSGRIVWAGPDRLHGRSRRGQLELAARFGFEGYPTPSGGCCWLADRRFARRLRDLLEHADDSGPDADCLERLRVGRHFRLSWDVKVVVGRNEAESSHLLAGAGSRWTVQVVDRRGALAVIEGRPEPGQLADAAGLAARYSASRAAAEVEVRLRHGSGETTMRARPADERSLSRWRV